ncbi:MAG: hypothetical protein AAGF13_08030 [Pseudomonadota bacterium]
MTPEQEAAYERAVEDIQTAIEESVTSLSFDGEEDLVELPSEIEELGSLTSLDLTGTGIQDFDSLRALSSLRTLNLSRTSISKLYPLSGLIALQVLALPNTQVSDLTALVDHPALRRLVVQDSQISDLRPLLTWPAFRTAAEKQDFPYGLWLKDSAATKADPALAKIAEENDGPNHEAKRALLTLDHLATLPPWPEPLPWEVKDAPKPPGTKSSLNVGWNGEQIDLNTDPSNLADDPVAMATAEDMVAALDDLMRLTGNTHVDIYRRAERLRQRLTDEKLDPVRIHLAFQPLHRVYDARAKRNMPLDDDTAATLLDIVQHLPGLTMGDAGVKELLARQREAHSRAAPRPSASKRLKRQTQSPTEKTNSAKTSAGPPKKSLRAAARQLTASPRSSFGTSSSPQAAKCAKRPSQPPLPSSPARTPPSKPSHRGSQQTRTRLLRCRPTGGQSIKPGLPLSWQRQEKSASH